MTPNREMKITAMTGVIGVAARGTGDWAVDRRRGAVAGPTGEAGMTHKAVTEATPAQSTLAGGETGDRGSATDHLGDEALVADDLLVRGGLDRRDVRCLLTRGPLSGRMPPGQRRGAGQFRVRPGSPVGSG
jgi:hypothetical protein